MPWLLFVLFLTTLRQIQAGFSNQVQEDDKTVLRTYLFELTSRIKTLVASFRRGRSTTKSFTHNRNALFPVKGQLIDRIAQF